MKKLQIILFFLIGVNQFCISQTAIKKKDTIDINKIINEALVKYENEIDSSYTYNSTMLNLFFNKGLENYITSVEVPSVKKMSAVVDNDDNSFYFGSSFDFRDGDKTKYLSFLFSTGIRLKGKKDESFYTLFESDKAKNNIGAELKATWFIPGSMFKPKGVDYRGDIKTNRDSKIKKEAINNFKDEDSLDYETVKKFIIEKEVEYIKSEEKFSKFSKSWLSLNLFFPITKNKYEIVNNAIDFNKSESFFQNWEASFSYNIFIHLKKKKSFTISFVPKIFNNNNILIETLKSTSFTTLTSNSLNTPIETKTSNHYVGTFDEFETFQIKTEVTSLLFFKGSLGVSGALELNDGKNYDHTNWKLGLPISLKDSKGKPSINFELQWREINKKHLVGISVGKTFGKYVK